MSKFRERARATMEAGKAERGNFTPHGKPLEIYKYWARYSDNVPARENFCHYWRVVGIWAPLMYLRRKLDNKVGVILLAVIAAAIIIPLCIMSSAVATIVGVFIGSMITAAVVVGGLTLLERRFGKNALTRVCDFVLIGMMGLFLVVMLVILVKVVVSSGWLVVLMGLGIVAAATIGFATVVWGLAQLIQYFSGRRAQRRVYRAPTTDGPQKPGIVRRFFSVLLDFGILVTQVVRVKKWKICPLVNVPDDELRERNA